VDSNQTDPDIDRTGCAYLYRLSSQDETWSRPHMYSVPYYGSSIIRSQDYPEHEVASENIIDCHAACFRLTREYRV
jgi:hypothetical protein